MKIAFKHSGHAVASIQEVIARFPEDEFKSPERSTVPSIAYWSNTAQSIGELCDSLNLHPPEECTLEFEYQVPPPKGKGKASHTDVMLWWEDACIGIEAKYTEPPYETVGDWLLKGTNPINRQDVLSGWCDLIESATGSACDPDALADTTYQMVHRIASVCSREEPNKHVVYQIFDPTPEKITYYHSELKKLEEVLSTGTSVGLHLAMVEIERTPAYLALTEEWRRRKKPCSDEVIAGLKAGTLLSCSTCAFEMTCQ